jgi:hypothetical protein
MPLNYNAFFTRYGYFHFAYAAPHIVSTAIPLVGRTRLGILFQPVCSSTAKYPIVLLEFDPTLRDYILLSQTFPSQLPPLPLPPSSATWLASNVQEPASLTPIELSINIPDNAGALFCQTTQHGADLFLGVGAPGEFHLTLELSGTVLGSIYIDFPDLSPSPPPPPLLPPPPPLYGNILVDGSFPPGFEYPPGFLWPSQVHTFYPWYYIMYNGEELPPLEMIPYIPTQLTG